MIVPAVLSGRARTMLDAVWRRPWRSYDRRMIGAVIERVKFFTGPETGLSPSDRLVRFARRVRAVPRPVRYLEIGSHKGISLVLVHLLVGGQLEATCVDPFEEHPEFPNADWSETERQFRAHAAAVGANVRLLKGRAVDKLQPLIDAHERFDLIFVDGSHRTLDVMTDAVLAWQVLAPGRMMIFDDYWYDAYLGEPYTPKHAIDAFIGMVRPEVIDVAGQVFVRRPASLASPAG